MAKDKGDNKGSGNPIQIQKYLEGLDYPTDKKALVEAAKKNGADQSVIDMLNRIPDRQYGKPTDVSRELGMK